MELDTPAIRCAIADVLEGTLGALATDVFLRGRIAGKTNEEWQTLALEQPRDIARNRFEVNLPRMRSNGGSPISATAENYLIDIEVEISVLTATGTIVGLLDRDEVVGQLARDLAAACRAVEMPGVLELTADGQPTAIVSGLMQQLGKQGRPEWIAATDNYAMQFIPSRIFGLVTVEVTDS